MSEKITQRRIIGVRKITDGELKLNYWDGAEPCPILTLDDGTLLYPAADAEGNGPGQLFGQSPDGTSFIVGFDGERI
jgi:hypothetical protein